MGSSSSKYWVVACARCSLRAWKLLVQLLETEDGAERQGSADVRPRCMMLRGIQQQQGGGS